MLGSLQGAKPVPLAAAVGLGVALRFLVPIPAGITVQAWTLLSIFVSAIVGEHWTPSPGKAVAINRKAGRVMSKRYNWLASSTRACWRCAFHTRDC